MMNGHTIFEIKWENHVKFWEQISNWQKNKKEIDSKKENKTEKKTVSDKSFNLLNQTCRLISWPKLSHKYTEHFWGSKFVLVIKTIYSG